MYDGAIKTAAANANAAQSGGAGRAMRSKSSTTIEEVKEGAQEGEGDDGGVTAVAVAARRLTERKWSWKFEKRSLRGSLRSTGLAFLCSLCSLLSPRFSLVFLTEAALPSSGKA